MCDLPFATVYHHFMRHDFNIYHTLPHSFPSVHHYLPSCNMIDLCFPPSYYDHQFPLRLSDRSSTIDVSHVNHGFSHKLSRQVPYRSHKCPTFPTIWVCLKIVYPYTQWFCWSLSLLNGHNWGYTPFSDIPIYVYIYMSHRLSLHFPINYHFDAIFSQIIHRRSHVNQ